MMRPSSRAVAVAYQRPCVMASTCANFWVAGSKTVARASPVNAGGSYSSVPPMMRARPSGKNAMPLQKTSHGRFGRTVIVPACGSQTAALEMSSAFLSRSFSEPATTSTLPVRSSPR